MNNSRVLFVDDEVGVLKSIKRLFRSEPIDVHTACSGKDALSLLEETNFKVIVSDQRMPEMTGTDFLAQARTQRPHSIRVILSGYAEMHAIVDAINEGEVYKFMTKPWDDAELIACVRHCIGRYDDEEAIRAKQGLLQTAQSELRNALDKKESLIELARDILDQLPFGVIAVDQNSRTVYVNEHVIDSLMPDDEIILGQRLGGRWAALLDSTKAHRSDSPLCLTLAERKTSVCVRDATIGGEPFTLLAIPPSHSAQLHGDIR